MLGFFNNKADLVKADDKRDNRMSSLKIESL
ncbi:hypothetical protein E4N76_06710 [Treponema putidum]|uniref:Uncharacterized protein n=1 Tax=Treponema putidum TaxID=221027 RepID=A0AAE9SJU9_9SPIR|nr:hypothetical protein E4N76_06710 [Treponema putidum]UTY31150.1 hypothetical protein E4N75_06155 [Treponema putidum]UTY33587.1 hypothetical protein E4N74_05820 [Treponema putidum]